MINRLFELFGSAQQELVLVSPYFVPRNKGSAFLVAQAQSGVKVVVVTNSLSATDVVAVHSGYAKHRENLLAGGVEIFEVKATPDIKRKSWSLSSSSSLHAKTFVVDRRWVFVGSFNLDPRSAWLNTEMGVLIDSPALAQVMLQRLGENLGKVAYKLSLQEGELLWTDNASEQTYSAEPGSGWWRRFLAGFLSWMPIDSQL